MKRVCVCFAAGVYGQQCGAGDQVADGAPDQAGQGALQEDQQDAARDLPRGHRGAGHPAHRSRHQRGELVMMLDGGGGGRCGGGDDDGGGGSGGGGGGGGEKGEPTGTVITRQCF